MLQSNALKVSIGAYRPNTISLFSIISVKYACIFFRYSACTPRAEYFRCACAVAVNTKIKVGAKKKIKNQDLNAIIIFFFCMQVGST